MSSTTRETPHEYAQRRANDTGTPYAVWQCRVAAALQYVAYYCPVNVRTYGEFADVVQIYQPTRAASSSPRRQPLQRTDE